VDAMHLLGMKKVSIICPYMKPLTKLVVDYIENQVIEVQDFLALEIPDNLEVAARDPNAPADLWKKLDTKGIDGIIASACVQMPSLPAVEKIEKMSGLPTLSAAVATTWSILDALKLDTKAPGGGTLLA
jgi:maleate isomerase